MLSDRYISDRYLPDKAIDLMDEAASKARLAAYTRPPDLRALEQELQGLRQEKEAAVAAQEFERAAGLRDKERQLQAELQGRRQEWEQRTRSSGTVDAQAIAEVVSGWTGIPVGRLQEGEAQRLLGLEEALSRRVVGQQEAVAAVARAVRRGRVGLKDPERPVGSFLFLGPTGVGKTELSRALAEAVYGSEEALIRLDMSEYMEKHTVSRLIGSPPGYVGYEEGGQLTERVRRRPYSVVLFDELEKAHPDVWSILLQLLEDGRLTDAQGRKTDFRNTIVICTSNIGARLLTEGPRIVGFDVTQDSAARSVREAVLAELKSTLRPELLNRMDEIVVFQRLDDDALLRIAALLCGRVAERVSKAGLTLRVDDSALRFLIADGADPLYGARPLRRAVVRRLEDGLSSLLLDGTLKPGQQVVCREQDGSLVFESDMAQKTP